MHYSCKCLSVCFNVFLGAELSPDTVITKHLGNSGFGAQSYFQLIWLIVTPPSPLLLKQKLTFYSGGLKSLVRLQTTSSYPSSFWLLGRFLLGAEHRLPTTHCMKLHINTCRLQMETCETQNSHTDPYLGFKEMMNLSFHVTSACC